MRSTAGTGSTAVLQSPLIPVLLCCMHTACMYAHAWPRKPSEKDMDMNPFDRLQINCHLLQP